MAAVIALLILIPATIALMTLIAIAATAIFGLVHSLAALAHRVHVPAPAPKPITLPSANTASVGLPAFLPRAS